MLKKAAASLALVPALSFAAVPAAVDTAISGAGTDASTVGWAVVGVIALIFAIALVRRVLR